MRACTAQKKFDICFVRYSPGVYRVWRGSSRPRKFLGWVVRLSFDRWGFWGGSWLVAPSGSPLAEGDTRVEALNAYYKFY